MRASRTCLCRWLSLTQATWVSLVGLSVLYLSASSRTVVAEGPAYTLERAGISYAGGVSTGGSYVVVDPSAIGPMTSPEYSIESGTAVLVGGSVTALDSVLRGDDVCVGGGNAGQACAQNSECPGGFCRLKNRFISAQLPATANAHGVKVNLVAIDANSVGTPSNYNGTDRWAGVPALGINDGISPAFNAGRVQCAFAAQDWSAVGLLHIYGDVIVPLSSYDVSMCSSAAGPCSSALRIGTAKFGDVVTPVNTVNFQDVNSIVAKFQGAPTGPSKTRTKLTNSIVNPANPINFQEVSACVSAFQSKAFKTVVTSPPVVCP